MKFAKSGLEYYEGWRYKAKISKLRNFFDFKCTEKFNLDIAKIENFENFFDFECSEGEGVEEAGYGYQKIKSSKTSSISGIHGGVGGMRLSAPEEQNFHRGQNIELLRP